MTPHHHYANGALLESETDLKHDPSTEIGSRISVVGTSGAGKTYVAEALAEKLGLTYICNDAIIHGPNWRETPEDEVYEAIDAATSQNCWTFDGNLGRKPEDRIVLERCDTLVWLDLPRWQLHGQVLARTIRRMAKREVLWRGNIEPWSRLFSRDSIVWWSLKTYRGRRRAYAALFADPSLSDKCRIRLTSRAQVNEWLAAIGQPVATD